MRLRRVIAPVTALLAGLAGALGVVTPAHAAANPGPGFPAQFAAPYVETWNSPAALTNARTATGLKYFTLAFVINGGGSCNPTFNGDIPLTDAGWTGAINTLRAAGGDVIASFGGASGTELAQACTSVSSLQAAYKNVIDTLNLTRVDFDIEGSALDDTAANDRRNQALANLQAQYAGQGRTLNVQYTLPVLTSGLLSNAQNLLKNAKSRNVDVNLVNIMTMDYGPNYNMGQAAIDAATALQGQLGAIWTGKSAAQLWAMEGNTPMIGVNDSTNEVFTTANASALVNFAKSKGIRELAFWALGRDKACATNGTLSDSCSGTPQSAFQFASIFNGVTGGGGGGGARTGQITGLGGLCLDDRSASTANSNPVQVYTCNASAAQQWTVGSDSTLRVLGKCLDIAGGATNDGAKVGIYDCNGTGAQVWQPRADGSLFNPQSGRCLDDTDRSTTPGTQVQIWACGGGTNQRWNVPA
ncbi:ricin-type beta-trefoil lectin domain protein [Kitasatospora sp. NPDC057223]|uniref:ricin-type beta-trefoil lectin domain protein n=1 Tax=Kitasatospora sp. NPDC057223 TaxID=3346055 RepID=UPI0036306A6C